MAGEGVEATQMTSTRRPLRGDVFGRAMGSGLGIGAAAGVASGAASFGPLGALFGLVFGLMATVMPTALGAALLATVAPAENPKSYFRRVDLVLGGCAGLAFLGTGWWVRQDALAGAAAPIAALVTVLVGLWLARRWLRALAVPPHRSF